MMTFIVAIIALLLGYLIYGAVIEKVIRPTTNPTPAVAQEDGVDFIPLPTWKVFMIQLLNIAGLGPIFGALGGALWGPAVYLWIVLGTIFAGAVHDYMSGIMSVREKGASISEIVGKYLGNFMLQLIRLYSVVLLILVGAVFTTGPAGLLATLTGVDSLTWVIVLLIYYFLATLLPIDALIARFYPIFGVCLLFMAVGIAISLIYGGATGSLTLPELTLENLHPKEAPIWPLMFITVACGAISGFHATQSPLMARCIKTEKLARPVFYGSMVAEGFIALVWATAGITFYESTGGLAAILAQGGPSTAVYEICVMALGTAGAVLAMLGVIACPITSADTAFRSSRLILADWLGIEQKSHTKRLLFAVPIVGIGAALTQIDFTILWRYFAWANQTLAVMVLWTGAMYLWVNHNQTKAVVLLLVPAIFMTAATFTYIMGAPEGFQLASGTSQIIGIVVAVLFTGLYLKSTVFRSSAA